MATSKQEISKSIKGFLFFVLLMIDLVSLSALAYGKGKYRACSWNDCDVYFISATSNDPSETIDPGKNKDVGTTLCELRDTDQDGFYDTLLVNIENAYPCYSSSVGAVIFNGGLKKVRVTGIDLSSDDEIELSFDNLPGYIINPQETLTTTLSMHVKEEVSEGGSYHFSVKIHFSEAFCGGLGFWKNWDKHKTFTEEEIEGWLEEIDSESFWLGPTTVEEMEDYLSLKRHSSMKERFLAHYLCSRLNVQGYLLNPYQPHDVSGYDPYNYLQLANPSSATLKEIIEAIEAKYGTDPTKKQFEIMKNICEGINELLI